MRNKKKYDAFETAFKKLKIRNKNEISPPPTKVGGVRNDIKHWTPGTRHPDIGHPASNTMTSETGHPTKTIIINKTRYEPKTYLALFTRHLALK